MQTAERNQATMSRAYRILAVAALLGTLLLGAYVGMTLSDAVADAAEQTESTYSQLVD